MVDLDQLLAYAIQAGASDVHIKVGSPPCIRVDGKLTRTEFETLSAAETDRLAHAMMPPRRAAEFADINEADFAYSLSGVARFRVNVFRQRGSVGIVMRQVPSRIQSFDELGLPPVVRRLAEEPRGLVLVTGPTGSGKTTTLAAVIDHINATSARHIVTIEDPIEVLHEDKRSIVNQREVGQDTADFLGALKRAMRQDPDVILIGEMRDTETVRAALAASETGHLVLSTLHTIDATETVHRIIDFFPPHQQNQIRQVFAGSLRGIVSQRLVERRTGGRVPAVEVLVNTGRVFDRIIDPEQTHDLVEVIREGEYYGMQTFDRSLLGLYLEGRVGLREALASATNAHDLRLMIEQEAARATEAAAAAG